MRKRMLITALFALALLVPFASAAAAVSPGSTTTIMGMPVVQNFTGLTADTAYDLICTTGTNYTVADAATSDSDGEMSLTVAYFDDYGQNTYVLVLDSGSQVNVVSFNIDNLNIILYLTPVIIIGIVFALVGSIKGAMKM